MDKDELLELERSRVEEMFDAIIRIRQYIHKNDIHENEKMHASMLSQAFKLRSYANMFTHTERIVSADNGWDDIG